MSIADMHARWRQKVSSSDEPKPDRVQRMWAAGGAAGGLGLGGLVGGGAGAAWAASRYPWQAGQEIKADYRHIEKYDSEIDELEELVRRGRDNLKDDIVAKQKAIGRLERTISQTEAAMKAGERRFLSASGLGLAAGALAGGVGGYYALKHLARPSE